MTPFPVEMIFPGLTPTETSITISNYSSLDPIDGFDLEALCPSGAGYEALARRGLRARAARL